MKKRFAKGAWVFAASLTVLGSTAHAQDAGGNWIKDMLNPSCSAESKDALAGDVRDKIEQSVARAMASIQPPAAVGDLSCLNDLMNAPLDTFSNVGGLLGNLQGGLSGSIGGTGDISRKVCEFAAEKWEEVAGPLTEGLGDLTNASGSGSNLWDNFDLENNGSAPTNTSTGSGTWNGNASDDLEGVDPGDLSGDGDTQAPYIQGCTVLLMSQGYCRIPPATTQPPVFGGGGGDDNGSGASNNGNGSSSSNTLWDNMSGGGDK